MTTKERKERADRIRNIRRMVRLLVDEHDRDKDIAERRKKTRCQISDTNFRIQGQIELWNFSM